MLTALLDKLRRMGPFNPSSTNSVSETDLVKILKGQTKNTPHSKDAVYFIVCRNGTPLQNHEWAIKIDDIPNVVESVFDKSEWFGKFVSGGQSQIIVHGQYDLLVNPKKKQIFLTATERARYYGSGNLQLDKDLTTRLLRTDIGFEKLREIVNATCSRYQYAYSLNAWKK